MNKESPVSQYVVRDCLPTDIVSIINLLDSESQRVWSKNALQDAITTQHYLLRVIGESNGKNLWGFYIAQRVLDQLTLMYVAVSQPLRQYGLGKLLMNDLIDRAKKQNCNQVLLELRKSNHAAKSLYAKMGFQQVGLRENYYPPLNPEKNNQREAALLYTLNLN